MKTVNTDGSYSYSPIKSVKFELPVEWQVYPNPSDGIFNLVVQTNGVIEGTIKVIDSKGSLVKEEHFTGNGSAQKISVDLSANNFAKGVYMLQVTTQFKTQLFKLYKK